MISILEQTEIELLKAIHYKIRWEDIIQIELTGRAAWVHIKGSDPIYFVHSEISGKVECPGMCDEE